MYSEKSGESLPLACLTSVCLTSGKFWSSLGSQGLCPAFPRQSTEVSSSNARPLSWSPGQGLIEEDFCAVYGLLSSGGGGGGGLSFLLEPVLEGTA